MLRRFLIRKLSAIAIRRLRANGFHSDADKLESTVAQALRDSKRAKR